jgi:hypothetical protein
MRGPKRNLGNARNLEWSLARLDSRFQATKSSTIKYSICVWEAFVLRSDEFTSPASYVFVYLCIDVLIY